MKNLLIYTGPNQKFDKEYSILARIQIDNSLDLGWKKNNILLVTDFPYEYNGIRSLIIPDGVYCDFDLSSNKTIVCNYLLNHGIIEPDEFYWAHDFDVYQNEAIMQSELESELGTADIGLCDKGRMPTWNMGSIFLKSGSKDIFYWIKDILNTYKINEEDALWILGGNDCPADGKHTNLIKGYTSENIPDIENINKRIKKINISYNLRMWNIRSTYPMALKPIRAVQFFPFEKNELDFFMYGINKINTVLMPERLIKIFNKHGI